MEQFRECLTTAKYESDVKSAANEAMGEGAAGTPAFVVGKSTVAGVEGELVLGAEPFGTFDQLLGKLSSH